MAQGNQGPIKFQIREEMWLDHNARSAEIASLSLEPEVEVLEESGLVMIKGYLNLSGRYDAFDEEDKALDVDADNFVEQLHFQPMNMDQRELYEKEHRGRISKRFPVDITVPQDKVKDINQVFVQVSHFDYNFEDGHRLQIEADVEISGIQSDREQDVVVEKRNGELRAERAAEVYAPFAVSATREEQDSRPDEMAAEAQVERDGEVYQDATATQKDEENNTEEETSMNHRHEQYEEAYTATPTDEDRPTPVNDVSTEETVQEDPELHAEKLEAAELVEVDEAPSHVEEDENVIQLFDKREVQTKFHAAKSEEEDVITGDDESKTTAFLSQLMASKDEEDASSTIRVTMCIAQKDESLEDIAERYALKVTDIMRFNSLQTQEIKQGQIIYIPKK